MKELNHIIKRYMDDQHINITRLSKEVNIGRVNLGYKLDGKREMTVSDLRKIVNALNITAEDLKKGMTL